MVSFPEDLGFSGYAYKKNAICMMNDFSFKMKNSIQQMITLVPAIGPYLFTPIGYAFLGPLLARDANYAAKLDNFIEYNNIKNFCISSIEDEEFIGFPESCGVI